MAGPRAFFSQNSSVARCYSSGSSEQPGFLEAEVYARAGAAFGARGATGAPAAARHQTCATDHRRCDSPPSLTPIVPARGSSWQVTQPDGSVIEWELLREPEVDSSDGASLLPVKGEHPRGHSYSASLMSKALDLVLSANNSFRGAARSLQILGEDAAEGCPSLWSIRNWVLRVGLYELERPKPRTGDWALILDHTIQIGPHKALLVLGVQLGQLDPKNFALGHQDMTAFSLEIVEQSNAGKVLETLERITEQIGEPRVLVSDAGSDIKKAASLFCERSSQTDWVPDVGHRMARLLEAELKGDPKWESFLSQAAQCRSRCQQTPLSPWLPPPQRSKARWMNLQPLITWGVKMTQNPMPAWAEAREFKRLFDWLYEFEEDLGDYWTMMHMGQETCRIIKQGGIGSESLGNCREMLKEHAGDARLRRHAAGIRDYLKEAESKLKPGETLLGSSDIIESVFGKYKFLVERSPQKEITRLILSIGALTSKRTPELVRAAMETIKMESVANWFKKYVVENARSLRKAAFG